MHIEPLFNRESLSEHLATLTNNIEQEVEAAGRDLLDRNLSEETAKFINKYKIQIPRLDRWKAEVLGDQVEYTLYFDGDARNFGFWPIEVPKLDKPEASLISNCMSFYYEKSNGKVKIAASFEEDQNKIEVWLGALSSEVHAFNKNLQNQVQELLEGRVRNMKQDMALEQDLNRGD